MEIFAAKKIYATNPLKDATEALSLGKEWPGTLEFALLRESKDMRLPGMTARRAIKAGREDDWSQWMMSVEVNLWMMEKLKECYYQAKQQDDQRRCIPCSRKPIRTISGFLESISRFEFEFSSSRKLHFLNDSNFWCVQSSTTSNVAVHVPVLWPVCAHAIPFRMLWCL